MGVCGAVSGPGARRRAAAEVRIAGSLQWAALEGAGGCGVAAPVDRPDSYFTYACDGTAATYTWTATGKADKGMSGFRYSINQQNLRVTVSWPSSWGSVPTAGVDSWVFQ